MTLAFVKVMASIVVLCGDGEIILTHWGKSTGYADIKGMMTDVSNDFHHEPLRRWEKWALAFFPVFLVGFGVLVEIRSVYLHNRMTDVGCYLRAAWAVRANEKMYEVMDDNLWHYAYPPVFAVVIYPFMDAPTGYPRDGMLPYSCTVAIWYLGSVVISALAIHWIAKAIEISAPVPTRRYSRKWWYTRLLPFYICAAPIGYTLSRGQVNMFVVALVAGMFLAMVRSRWISSGIWLGAAICLKIYPAYLLVFPVWRRDLRTVLGTLIALNIGVIVIPTCVWGFKGAVEVHRQMLNAVILPGIGAGGDNTRDKELMEITATDNQSIQAVLHYWLHIQEPTRPPHVSKATKIAHMVIGSLMTGLLILAYGWKRDDNAIRMLLFLGGLVMLIAIISPLSHTHYFCLAVPLVMGIAAHSVSHRPDLVFPQQSTMAILIAAGLCFTLPMFEFWKGHREVGLPLLGSVILCAAAVRILWKTRIR